MQHSNGPTYPTLKPFFERHNITGNFITQNTIDFLKDEKGAYVLIIDLIHPVIPKIRTVQNTNLSKGTYLYAGNAYGSGGIKSRLKRHLKTDKKIHWHIDHITTQAKSISALAIPNGNECNLVQSLSSSERIRFPIKGFGSSDCAFCISHLMQIL
jgi:Uri superfamily endonuclease